MSIRLFGVISLVVVATGGRIAFAASNSLQPAGQMVFTRSVGENGTPSLYVVGTHGLTARLLAHNASEAAVAPDGRWIAFVRDSAIWVMKRDGSDARPLTMPNARPTKGRRPPNVDGGPAWSPDGRTIYFSRWVNKAYAESLFSLHKDGTTLRQLTQPRNGWETSPAPSPDGHLIVFARTSESAGMHDLANTLSAVTSGGRPERLPFRLPNTRDSSYGDSAAAPILRDPAWSPNGQALAYEASDTSWNTGFAAGLYVSSVGGSLPRRLVADGSAPAWSLDGKWIGFTDRHHIWLVRSGGTGRRQLTRGAANDRDPAWLPPSR